jgi:hypothetical protein
MVQLAVQRLDELDALTQRCGKRLHRHLLELAKVLEAGFPPAVIAGAVIAPLAGGCKHVVVLVVVFFYELLDE